MNCELRIKKSKNAGFTHTLIFASLHSFFNIFYKKLYIFISKRFKVVNGPCNKKTMLKLVSGFTIIETMIAVSLFLVVVTAGMNALLNANLLHQKSQDMRSILDNLSFIMEDMSRNIRTGYDYHCFSGIIPSGSPNSQSCSNGKGISFKSADGSQWVYYVDTTSNGYGIFKSINGVITQLTPNEVNIDSLASGFSVLGAEPPQNPFSSTEQQPFVTIRLIGIISFKGVDTPFSLQTSVSQRLIDVI